MTTMLASVPARVGRGLAGLVLCLTAAGCARPSPLPTTVDAAGLPTTFVAEYEYGAGDTSGGHGTYLSLFDAATGRHLRDVMHWPAGAQPVLDGFSRAPNGDIWLTEQSGPGSTGMGIGVVPHSCGGRLIRVDHTTGVAHTVVTVDRDTELGDPVASPDGRRVAYLSGPCGSMYNTANGPVTGDVVVVRDLASGHSTTLRMVGGAGTSARWAPDGRVVVEFVFMYQGNAALGSQGYVIVPAGVDATLHHADIHLGDRGCEVVSVGYDAAGPLLLEGCPTATGTARLTQLDPALHPLWSVVPIATPNGGSVSVAPDGHTIMVETWDSRATTSYVSVYDGRSLTKQFAYGTPTAFVSGATW